MIHTFWNVNSKLLYNCPIWLLNGHRRKEGNIFGSKKSCRLFHLSKGRGSGGERTCFSSFGNSSLFVRTGLPKGWLLMDNKSVVSARNRTRINCLGAAMLAIIPLTFYSLCYPISNIQYPAYSLINIPAYQYILRGSYAYHYTTNALFLMLSILNIHV